MDKPNEPIHLYICDGTKCRGSSDCYLAGGACSHTSDIGHSIKRINPDIPTRWEKYTTCFVERVVIGEAEE